MYIAGKPGWTTVPTMDELEALEDMELLKRAVKAAGVDAETLSAEMSEVDNPKRMLAEKIIAQLTGEDGLDFKAALSDTWTVEMDAALIAFVTERAVVKEFTSVAQLKPEHLFEKAEAEEGTESAVSAGESTPDKTALMRNVSIAPRFTQQDIQLSPKRRTRPTSLDDNSQAAIRARFLLCVSSAFSCHDLSSSIYTLCVSCVVQAARVERYRAAGASAHRPAALRGGGAHFPQPLPQQGPAAPRHQGRPH